MSDDPVCNGSAHGNVEQKATRGKLPNFVYDGEVAITGISGRLPESNNIQEFRDHLMNKEDMVTADDRRWAVGMWIFTSLNFSVVAKDLMAGWCPVKSFSSFYFKLPLYMYY